MCTTASDIGVCEESTSMTEFATDSTDTSTDQRETPSTRGMSATENSELDPLSHSELKESLVTALLSATKTDDFAHVLYAAWTPSEEPSLVGSFPHLSEGELLLNAIPLSQKLLACMAARSIDLNTSYACADLLSILSLDQESTMLLRPATILEAIIRLLASDREETRGGALRCMTSLITGSDEYCQCFMKSNVVGNIFGSLQTGKKQSAAAYACRTAASLTHFLANKEDQLETLLSDVMPGLLDLLSEEVDTPIKLCSLECLRDIKSLPVVVEKIEQYNFVSKLASLISTEDERIQSIAIDLFGPYITTENSESIKALPADIAYHTVKKLFGNDITRLEDLCVALLDSILTAVHRNDFKITDDEAHFFTEVILGDSKACLSKAVDILVAAWDMEEHMADCLVKVEGFLSQLPQVMTVTQAALHIIHSMIQARVETCHEMAKVIGPSEIECFRKEMQGGTFEVTIMILDIFLKMIEQENRSVDLINGGVVKDIVDRMDSESYGVKQRCWKICKCLLEENEIRASEVCIQYGIVQKCGAVFDEFLNISSSSLEQYDLKELFQVLNLVSRTKDGAKAICDVGFLLCLIKCLEPGKDTPPEIFDILVNVFEIIPLVSSRIFIENGGLGLLIDSIKSVDIKVKRQTFQILKLLSFKDPVDIVQSSSLIVELCTLLQDPNPRLVSDVVTVLCKISKSDMDTVCYQIVSSGLSNALWTASRNVAANSEEYKTLWKIIQGVRSVEASSKATSRQKQSTALSRRSSISASEAKFDGNNMRTPRNDSRRGGRSRRLSGSTSVTTLQTKSPVESPQDAYSPVKESKSKTKCQIPKNPSCTPNRRQNRPSKERR